MRTSRYFILATVLIGMVALGLRAGLYDDEKKVTSGDVRDLDYWHAKFYHEMLEAALKSHEPEYLVGKLASVQSEQTLPPLIKKYPNHEDLKKWQVKYEEVAKAVDKNASNVVQWKPEFAYWDNEHYRQGWVNMNMGRMAAEAKDWPDAASRYSFAAKNLDILVDHDDWTKNWPDDVKKWIKDTKADADSKAAEMKKKA